SPARAAPVSASPRPEPQPQPSAPTCFPGAGSAQFCGRARGRLRPRSPGGGAPGRAGGRAKWRAGVGARGGRSRLRLGPRGSRLGPPADARRPPPAARWARGARSLPCADPGGPAEAGRAAGQSLGLRSYVHVCGEHLPFSAKNPNVPPFQLDG
uniref:Uncharacterized protein n=1 Tax=Mustela putorius furo TaxID=9669 RepID=M3Y4R8_MUSPF